MPRLAFATYAADSDHGGERALLVPLLAERGVEVEAHPWTDPVVDWASFDGVVIKSTWDYFENIGAFGAWLDAVSSATRLANPVDVVRWNSDKRYLLDLGTAGVPTIPTQIIEPGAPVALPDWAEVVVKPSVSGGGRFSGRFTQDQQDAAERLIAIIHGEGNAALLQPYLDAVDSAGEANVLTFGGVPSHAVTKGGILATGFEPDAESRLYLGQSITPLAVDDELTAFADVVLTGVEQVLGIDRTALVHGRVDSVVDADGTRRLMEVELIEPYLYFDETPDPAATAAAYADVLERWLTS